MKNNITHTLNQQGERLENHGDIEAELIRHFKSVHLEPPINRKPAIDKILSHIPKLIIEKHNHLLLRPVTLLEVDSAMKQMQEGKAPGPDSFTSTFFHHFGNISKRKSGKLSKNLKCFTGCSPP